MVGLKRSPDFSTQSIFAVILVVWKKVRTSPLNLIYSCFGWFVKKSGLLHSKDIFSYFDCWKRSPDFSTQIIFTVILVVWKEVRTSPLKAHLQLFWLLKKKSGLLHTNHFNGYFSNLIRSPDFCTSTNKPLWRLF